MFFIYCVPVSVTSQLKVVSVPVFAAAVSVRVAWIDAPAFRTVFWRFQDRVRYVLALDGLQLLVVMVSVSAMLPVFLTYTVWVAVPPGLRVPAVRAVAGVCACAVGDIRLSLRRLLFRLGVRFDWC